jgi:hypothetical protein
MYPPTIFSVAVFRLALFSVPALLVSTSSAWSQDTPPLTLTAGYTAEADQTRYPTNTVEDRVGKAALGVQFHTIQGLQRLQLDAQLVNYQYQTATAQDHTETNYKGAWQWAVTPRLRGNLDASRQEAPRADFISGFGNVPNRQTLTHYRADAEYGIDGPWRVLAGLSRDQNESQYQNPNAPDSRNTARDVGVRYDFASSSWIKLSARAVDGSYLSGSPSGDDSYQQREQELRARWSLSTATTLDLYLVALERSHQRNSALDFNGQNYGANASWAVSANSTLVLGYAHGVGVVLVPAALFTAQDNLSVGWNWRMSSRTQLRLRQGLQRLAYRQQPGSGNVREDNSQDTSLALVWTPGTQWQLSAGVQQQAFTSTLPSQEYHSQQVSLSAQFSY